MSGAPRSAPPGPSAQPNAAADAGFEIEILVQLHIRPEIHELNLGVLRTDPVDATEALDDPHRVPMDVIVDEKIAILKVLAFGDAIGRYQQVDLTFCCKLRRALLRAGRERAEDRAHVVAQARQGSLVCTGSGDDSGVEPERFLRPGGQFPVEIIGRVGERGKK